MCGRGTTLNQVLMNGWHAAGLDVDARDFDAYAAFLRSWLKPSGSSTPPRSRRSAATAPSSAPLPRRDRGDQGGLEGRRTITLDYVNTDTLHTRAVHKAASSTRSSPTRRTASSTAAGPAAGSRAARSTCCARPCRSGPRCCGPAARWASPGTPTWRARRRAGRAGRRRPGAARRRPVPRLRAPRRPGDPARRPGRPQPV